MKMKFGLSMAAVGVLALSACVETLPPVTSSVTQEAVISDAIKTLAKGRVFFGHQSVGEDILNGLKDLLAVQPTDSSTPSLAIVDVQDSAGLPARGYILHTKVGENTKPSTKCSDFARLIEEKKDQIDVAVLKYCYVDVVGASDADALFADYQKQLQALRAKFPAITIVPATVPLTVSSERPDWARKNWEVKIRRVFGVFDRNDADNAKRARFNDLLRKAYAGSPYLDIAQIESTHPDGRREGFVKGGREIPSLIPAYTHDGGHLNETGRKLVAREFVKVLATAVVTHPATDSAAVSQL